MSATSLATTPEEEGAAAKWGLGRRATFFLVTFYSLKSKGGGGLEASSPIERLGDTAGSRRGGAIVNLLTTILTIR